MRSEKVPLSIGKHYMFAVPNLYNSNRQFRQNRHHSSLYISGGK